MVSGPSSSAGKSTTQGNGQATDQAAKDAYAQAEIDAATQRGQIVNQITGKITSGGQSIVQTGTSQFESSANNARTGMEKIKGIGANRQ